MSETLKPYDTVTDFITGKTVPLVGAEENRQMVEKLLIEGKGFPRKDIAVDEPIAFEVAGETYTSAVDLVVSVAGRPLMAVKCAAGSLGSREREAVAAARLVAEAPLPLAVVSDGRTAIVLDTATGRPIGEGLDAIPDRAGLAAGYAGATARPLTGDRLQKERLVFRSYDSMNVNTARRMD